MCEFESVLYNCSQSSLISLKDERELEAGKKKKEEKLISAKKKGSISLHNYFYQTYYPLIQKSEYFASHINGLIKHFFNDSASQFASFFTSETNLSKKELEELRDIVNKQIENKKN